MPATAMIFRVNQTDATHEYPGHNSDYITVDLINDYFIHTAGDTVVKDHMTTEPTPPQLNNAATIIDDALAITVALCLLFDYDGSPYVTHKVLKDSGGSDDQRYVFCFSFDGATAMIPRLEAWDTSAHSTIVKNVLGLGTPANSFVKAIKTTSGTPGGNWAGTAIAGSANYIELDTAALTTEKDLYCNLKIVIPITAIPAAEAFVLTCRYTYL